MSKAKDAAKEDAKTVSNGKDVTLMMEPSTENKGSLKAQNLQNNHTISGVYDNPAFNASDLPTENNANPYNLNDKEPSGKKEANDNEETPFSRIVVKIQEAIGELWTKNKEKVKIFIGAALLLTFYVYLGFALHYDFHKDESWCDGSRLLLILTFLAHFCILYVYVLKKRFGQLIGQILRPAFMLFDRFWRIPYVRWIFYLVVLAAIVIFIVVDSIDDPKRIVSASGILIIVIFGFVFSSNPSKVRWRPVLWGLFLQFIFALVILRWKFGRELFECMGEKVTTFLKFTDAGAEFVFGYLVSGEFKDSKEVDIPKQYPVFAFKVLSVIIFFNVIAAIMYYLGIMQVIIRKIGWLLSITVSTTAAESMNAAANVFLGMTEAPLAIAPYMPKMTKSELHSVMTGGFATIAGSIMAAYISFGIKASHLLSASVMSAPAALGFSKLFYPETEKSETEFKNIEVASSGDRNILEAASRGASQSISVIANITANLIAFLSCIAFIDALLSWFGGIVGFPEFSFEIILSKLFVPLALIMGVDLEDSEDVARLIGLKTVVNEFVAYARLGEFIKEGRLSARSEAIATYALCGFSNFGSIGILIGSLGALVPSKKGILAKLALRAMIAGSMACFLTACIAGTLIPTTELEVLTVISNATDVLNKTLTEV